MRPSRAARGLRSRLFVSSLAVAGAVSLALVAVGGYAAVNDYRTHFERFEAILQGGNHLQRERLLEAEFVKILLRALLVGGLVGVPLALGLATLTSRRLLDPIRRLSQAAKRIATGAYTERLPEQETEALGQLIEDFNHMAESLERVEAQRVALIGTVAHELRTPLMGLQGYAEGLREGVFSPDEAAESIRREVSRLRRVVNDLEQVSRAESGAVALKLEAFDLNALAADLARQYAPMFEDGGSRLRFSPSSEPALVRADRDRVAQIAVNLLSNALRYAPSGATELRVERVSSDHTASGEVRLTVTDRGPGIAPEHLPHLFERFYRADPARSGADNGSGVGLTISSALARALSGRIEVESRVGEGSRFTLVLPGL